MSARKPELFGGATEHYGCRVVELGEGGEEYAVVGHVSERRAVAAVLRYLRVVCGVPADEVARWWDWPKVRQRWLVHVDVERDLEGERDGWVWADNDREPITVVEL